MVTSPSRSTISRPQRNKSVSVCMPYVQLYQGIYPLACNSEDTSQTPKEVSTGQLVIDNQLTSIAFANVMLGTHSEVQYDIKLAARGGRKIIEGNLGFYYDYLLPEVNRTVSRSNLSGTYLGVTTNGVSLIITMDCGLYVPAVSI